MDDVAILHAMCASETADFFKRVEVKTAEEFLDILNVTDDRWISNNRRWVWRGQRNTWPLIPSAYRPGSWTEFAPNGERFEVENATDRAQIVAEQAILAQFYDALDATALPIPGDEAQLIRLAATGFREVPEWPSDPVLPLLSLAQHCGIPTRLLDWTDDPLVAAYFAVAGVKEDQRPVVYALCVDVVEQCGRTGAQGMRFRFVRSHHVTNPFLHAQRGRHLLLEGNWRYQNKIYSLDEVLGLCMKEQQPSIMSPSLIEVKLDGNSVTVLQLLARCGVNAATIRPSYQAVAECIRERTRWS